MTTEVTIQMLVKKLNELEGEMIKLARLTTVMAKAIEEQQNEIQILKFRMAGK